MTALLGWLGAILLATCAVPLVWQTIKDRHANGLNSTFLFCWLVGEALMLVHCIMLWPAISSALLANYAANVAMVGVVGWFKWRR